MFVINKTSIHEFSVNAKFNNEANWKPVVMYIGPKLKDDGSAQIALTWDERDIEHAIEYIESNPKEFGIYPDSGTDISLFLPEDYEFGSTNI